MKPVLAFAFILLTSTAFACHHHLVVQEQEKIPEIKLHIGYNQNVETLALVFNLSKAGQELFQRNPPPRAMLARVLTKRFDTFSEHEAVVKLNELLDLDLVDSYDILLALYNNPLPQFERYANYPEIYYEHDSLSKKQIKALFADFERALAKFYVDANLNSFFEEEAKTLYQKLMKELEAVAPEQKYITLMESYYGLERNAYYIIVSAFSFNGIGKSISIKTKKQTHIYQFVSSSPERESPNIKLENFEEYSIGYMDEDYFREIASHELTHTFFYEALNTNKKNYKQINSLSYLFTDQLKKDMARQAYFDWNTCFEEHLVRLGEIYIAEQLGNQKFAQAYYKECTEQRKLIYFDILKELMLDYAKNRRKYKNIKQYMPDLIHKFKACVQEDELAKYEN